MMLYRYLPAKKNIVVPPDYIWTERTFPTTGVWSDITFGNGLFVAVGNLISTSPDGINWTNRTPHGAIINSIIYGGGKFIATTFGGSNLIMRSDDGIAWDSVDVTNLLSGGTMRDVSYGNGVYVVVLENSARVLVSSDGINWSTRNLPSNSRWVSIVFGNGKFIIVTLNAALSAVSSDGMSWSGVAIPTNSTVRIDHFKGMFMAYQWDSAQYATSVTGTTGSWTARTHPTGRYYATANSPNVHMTVSFQSDTSVATFDGINWSSSPMIGTTRQWLAVAHGNGMFVAIASNSNILATTPSD